MIQETPRILVGIATVSPDKRFLESLPPFTRQVTERDIARLDFCWVWGKPLVEAQNDLAERLLEGSFTHLLTIEDDHWAFTAEMLKIALEADSSVAAIPYRSRHFPFPMIPQRFNKLDENGVKHFREIRGAEGYQVADLCGFGFTLIQREVFSKLDRPFFRLNHQYYKGVGPHATDIDFCARVQEAGFTITGCFQHRLNHRDITEEEYDRMKVEGILSKHSMFTYISDMARKKKYQQEHAGQPTPTLQGV